MNLCWIVDKETGGHVRDVDTEERAALLGAGYEEVRLTCVTPSGRRDGTLYDQGVTSATELAQHIEKSGLALFGGCTTIEVYRAGSAIAQRLPRADLAAARREVSPR